LRALKQSLAELAGIRAFAVHAKDDEARSFYRKFDFCPLPYRPHAPVRAAQGRAKDYFRAIRNQKAEKKETRPGEFTQKARLFTQFRVNPTADPIPVSRKRASFCGNA
jgi:hypothetical protein